MWPKFLLGVGFLLMLSFAFLHEPVRQRYLLGDRGKDQTRLRLMSWNIGYADLESETRARTEDLPSVAQVILSSNPDAVALQELTGEDQLKVLLTHLKNRYRGYTCSPGSADRLAAVLVKDPGAQFDDVPAGDRFAAAATFRLHKDLPPVVLVSAHADAFSSSRRRRFTEDVVDWARGRAGKHVFIAGDFNFEVSIKTKTNFFSDNAKHDSESYSYLLKYFRDLGRTAGQTAISDRRIDYVFGPLETVTLRQAEVLRETAIGRMDHSPLLVEIGIAP
jgi:endonuclease/exonuclease/phosphatase family metal-dependent hydrolase